MTNNALLVITGLFFLFFTVFSLWFLRREYRLRKKLTWAGSIVRVAMFAVHGMFCSLLVWGPETMPAMGAGAGLGIALMLVGLGVMIYAMDLFRRFSRWLGSDTPGLTTNGLYRFSRNPQFVGYGLFILGFFYYLVGSACPDRYFFLCRTGLRGRAYGGRAFNAGLRPILSRLR